MRFLLGPLGSGADRAAALHDLVELAGTAEESGFDGLLLAEARLPEADGWAAPLTIAMRLARRTTALRLGALFPPDVTNPIYQAEEVAVLDAVSAGRAFAVLRRASAEELRRLAGVPEPGDRRYAESLDVLLASWAPNPFTYDGEHWRVPGRDPGNTFAHGIEAVNVTPKPLQLTVPAWLLQAAEHDERDLARRVDLPLAVDAGQAPLPGSPARPSAAVRDLHVAPDAEQAWRQALPVLEHRHGRSGTAPADWAEHAVVGDVDACIAQVARLQSRGVGLLACRPLWPDADTAETLRLLRFVGEAIVPEFRMDAFPEQIRIHAPQGGAR
jgi:alkanesulfonate monooxygenase SsuD/methylene tetrahydromethanopterin reductase-like flavin-dependent oxidoreductase (luciferase family)